jgi:hypothetical protein
MAGKEAVMVELNESLQQALAAQPDEPLRLVDPRTRETYVLVRADVYERLKGLDYDDSDFAIKDAYPLMDEVASREGWNDPEMDSYNEPSAGDGR